MTEDTTTNCQSLSFTWFVPYKQETFLASHFHFSFFSSDAQERESEANEIRHISTANVVFFTPQQEHKNTLLYLFEFACVRSALLCIKCVSYSHTHTLIPYPDDINFMETAGKSWREGFQVYYYVRNFCRRKTVFAALVVRVQCDTAKHIKICVRSVTQIENLWLH